ncbi:hypothetical protein Bca4012_009094 [Brassica carinata]
MIGVKPLTNTISARGASSNSAHTLGFSMPRSSASKRTYTSVLKNRALAVNSSRYCRSKASGSAGLIPADLTEHLLRSWDVEPPPRTVVSETLFTCHRFSPPVISPPLREEDLRWRRGLAAPRAAAVKEWP